MVRRHETGQVIVRIKLETLWKALAIHTKSTIPACVPGWVTEAQTLQGDGGLDTIYLFKFGPDVENMKYQKERVAEYDELRHRIGLQVVEGGRLGLGFSYYKTIFQLTAVGEAETAVDVEVDYETTAGSCNKEQESPPGDGAPPPVADVKSAIAYVRALESFLLNKLGSS